MPMRRIFHRCQIWLYKVITAISNRRFHLQGTNGRRNAVAVMRQRDPDVRSGLRTCEDDFTSWYAIGVVVTHARYTGPRSVVQPRKSPCWPAATKFLGHSAYLVQARALAFRLSFPRTPSASTRMSLMTFRTQRSGIHSSALPISASEKSNTTRYTGVAYHMFM